jgi:hypothetical protein
VNRQYGFLAFCILALAACGTSSNGPSGNPLGGVTIIQPTAAPTTPAPTPTPTLAPNAVEALTDTGFESGGFSGGWTACSIPHVAPSSTAAPGATVAPGSIGAAIVSAASAPFQVTATPSAATTPAVYGGTYSAFTFSGTGAQTAYESGGAKTGPAGTNGICQTFTVPPNAVLTMYVNEGGSDSGLKYADQQADIISTGGVDTNLFYELDADSNPGTGTPATGGTWAIRGPYNLTSNPFNLTAGQSVTLFIGSYDSSPSAVYGVYMFVDDVTVIGT